MQQTAEQYKAPIELEREAQIEENKRKFDELFGSVEGLPVLTPSAKAQGTAGE